MTQIISNVLLIILFGSIGISCTNNKGEQNFKDLKNIQRGMKIEKVHALMENTRISVENAYWSDSLIVENYESGFGVSDHYKIVYAKKDSTVLEIHWGD